MENFKCSNCNKTKTTQKNGGTGYAVDVYTNEKICYECVGELDQQDFDKLKVGEKTILYLSTNKKGKSKYKVSNWCDTFSIPIYRIHEGNHNIAGKRYDFWFDWKGKEFWGVQYGDNTQIAHIKRLKD